jgi:hypothetical protein
MTEKFEHLCTINDFGGLRISPMPMFRMKFVFAHEKPVKNEEAN